MPDHDKCIINFHGDDTLQRSSVETTTRARRDFRTPMMSHLWLRHCLVGVGFYDREFSKS